MNEWNEQKLEQELEYLLEDVSVQEDLEKKIEQRIKKRVQRIVLRTMAVIVLTAAVLFLLISPFLDAVYLNPYKLEEKPEQTMTSVMRDYWETTEPYVEVMKIDVKKKGFSRYELDMNVTNHQEELTMGAPNVKVKMAFGKYKSILDPDSYLVHVFGRFEDYEENKEEILLELSKLPESARIYLAISEKEPRDLAELRKEEVHLDWIQVYQPDVEFQGGLSLQRNAAYDESDYREEMSAEELKDVYVAQLKNLLDNEQIWRELGPVSYTHLTLPTT